MQDGITPLYTSSSNGHGGVVEYWERCSTLFLRELELLRKSIILLSNSAVQSCPLVTNLSLMNRNEHTPNTQSIFSSNTLLLHRNILPPNQWWWFRGAEKHNFIVKFRSAKLPACAKSLVGEQKCLLLPETFGKGVDRLLFRMLPRILPRCIRTTRNYQIFSNPNLTLENSLLVTIVLICWQVPNKEYDSCIPWSQCDCFNPDSNFNHYA